MFKSFRMFAILVLSVLVVSACVAPAPAPAGDAAAPTEAPAADSAPVSGAIKIAFLGPLTGGAASLGQEQLGYAQIAAAIFNERTGMNVQVVENDTELNPDVAKTVAERLVADPEIIAVVGPAGSQECEATKPVFADGGLAHVTQSCTRTDLTSADKATDTFFRAIPVDDDQAKTDAAMMVGMDIKAAYLVDDQSSYSTGLNDALQAELEAAGVTVERGSVTQDDTDLSSIATGAIGAGAEVVFFSGQLANQLGTLAVQLKEQGFTGQYFLADAGFDPTWFETAGEAADGTYVSVFSPDPTTVESMKEYNDRYAATNDGKAGGAFGGASAQTAYVVLAAIEACKDDLTRACVITSLTSIKLDTSPLGVPVSFDENGQLTGAKFFLYQVKDGKFELVAN